MTSHPAPAAVESSLFTPEGSAAFIARVRALAPEAERQWGKLTLPGMLAHCRVAMEIATSGKPLKRSFIGLLLGWAVRGKMIDGDQPFGKNSPTDPRLILSDAVDLEDERGRLIAVIERFHALGPVGMPDGPHPFFGKLTAKQWDRLMAKHLDHHLRQFGV